ncbi:MAG TPA: LppP/LprE family lipoprotein [Vicinamibacterales bacterium]|nr:LppP/LprE family lipoprotein [Vicinamibacterales bacterium]
MKFAESWRRGGEILVALLFATAAFAQTAEPTWLDRPLSNWNKAATTLPRAVPNGETLADMMKRCADMQTLRNTPGERALADAGWLPFHLFDRQMMQRDVEIVGGLAGADGMCRPVDFNVFVFVAGRFAGMLSPGDMSSRNDGSVGAIRLAEDDTIAAEFARYAESDPLCCPSGRVTVRYRIDRKAVPPVVVPVSVQATRP